MYAARYNEPELVLCLLHNGADPSIKNNNGHTCVDLAQEDLCWAALLLIDPTQIPSYALSGAAMSPKRTRWGRLSVSVSMF